MTKMNFNFLFLLPFLYFTQLCFSQETAPSIKTMVIHKVFQVDINSSINPATFEHLKKAVKKVSATKDALLLIKMTTPGGLVSTTKEILNLFGNSEFPIVVWIAPEGSSATSAGAIIASGAHYLYMSDGTNIGAATPITLSGDIGEKPKKGAKGEEVIEGSDGRAKAVNDLVALVRSLSETRGRDAQSYASMIEDAKSYTSKEAEERKIIDKVANHLSDIYDNIGSKNIKIKGIETKVEIAPGVELEKLQYSLADTLLNTFSSPEVAYILFLLGAALIYFELQAPGGFIAGGFGIISLILAGIGFHVLPVNFGGIGLLVVSLVLFILEVYITSFGLLALGGIASLIFGSLILFETPDSLIALDRIFMITTIVSILLPIGAISFYLYKTRLKKDKVDFFIPLGHSGIIQDVLLADKNTFHYMAKINGVMWKVVAKEELPLGQAIKVDSQVKDSLILNISKL